MLNIDSEPMATPMHEAAPREEAQVDQRRLGTRLHDQQQNERDRREHEWTDHRERCRPRMRQGMQPEDHRHHQRGQQDKADPVRAPALRTVSDARSPSPQRRGRRMAINISGTLNQKIARHPVKCVSAPPSSGPMLKPSIRNPVQAPIAAARRSGVALVSTAARVLGTANAAARPCKARPASNAACVPAVAMMQDAMANSANPAIDTSRAPNRSAAWPPSTMKAAETTR